MIRNNASFRDPAGYIYEKDGRVCRTINKSYSSTFQSLDDSGFLRRLVDEGFLLDWKKIDEDLTSFGGPRGDTPCFILEHPRIDLITYPYEWAFSQLKDASLLFLRLQKFSIENGWMLSDASPFNIQKHLNKLCHIDHLSFVPYVEGEPWGSYGQFCKQFLYPLLLQSEAGIPFQKIYRGDISGIDALTLKNILGNFRCFSSVNLFLHLYLQAIQSVRATSDNFKSVDVKIPYLSKNRLLMLHESLIDWIESLEPSKKMKSYWADYAKVNSYQADAATQKANCITSFVSSGKYQKILDCGGNSGDYSVIALNAGAQIVYCADSDVDAIELAYRKSKKMANGLAPLVIDYMNPSPAMGWASIERRDFKSRVKVDCVMALAVIHHVVIGSNLPMKLFVNDLLEYGDSLIIEWVPKEDPMVANLLRFRADIFPEYTLENLMEILSENTIISNIVDLKDSQRKLIHCTKRGKN